MKVPRILIVAGSDSGGGAGIQADIRTVTMFGGHPMTAVTALTAQNSLGVEAVSLVPAEMVIAQIDIVLTDFGADAVKIGMIGSAATAEAVAERLAGAEMPIVFDPVMFASSGDALADPATIAAFGRLAKLSSLSTPNLPEIETLTGRTIRDSEGLKAAAVEFARTSGSPVLAKGGHLEGPRLVDWLILPDGEARKWESEPIETRHTHGTGCTLATAIACGLAGGRSLSEAISDAREFVRLALEAAPGFGAGHGPLGFSLGVEPWRLCRPR